AAKIFIGSAGSITAIVPIANRALAVDGSSHDEVASAPGPRTARRALGRRWGTDTHRIVAVCAITDKARARPTSAVAEIVIGPVVIGRGTRHVCVRRVRRHVVTRLIPLRGGGNETGAHAPSIGIRHAAIAAAGAGAADHIEGWARKHLVGHRAAGELSTREGG